MVTHLLRLILGLDDLIKNACRHMSHGETLTPKIFVGGISNIRKNKNYRK